jgi:hypothetical protein
MPLNNIPQELKALRQWVIADKHKVPLRPDNRSPASVTNPNTWDTFENAVAALAPPDIPNVGFVLTEKDPYVFIDLDRPITAEQELRHSRIVDAFSDSYMEISQSGEGVHIVCLGELPRAMKRDRVEVYDRNRYMICTGDSLTNDDNEPGKLIDQQKLLDVLIREGTSVFRDYEHFNEPVTLSDSTIIEKLTTESDKFTALSNGNWQDYYPSQSEADYAFFWYVAQYTKNDEQAIRLFHMSGLGQRSKAHRESYLQLTLGRIRLEQEDIETSTQAFQEHQKNKPIIQPTVVLDNEEEPEPVKKIHYDDKTLFPPGVAGELAHHMYELSHRPVTMISTVAAIGLLSGIASRGFSFPQDGVNTYQLLLAPTGVGKEAISHTIQTFIEELRKEIPVIENVLGPSVISSGPALYRMLSEKPSLVCVLNEMGPLLSNLMNEKASQVERVLNSVILDLYNKSSPKAYYSGTVYSDNARNIAPVRSPCFSFIGESVPDAFFNHITEQAVCNGFIPRLIISCYTGDRPPPNAVDSHMDSNLLTCLRTLAINSLEHQHNESFCSIHLNSKCVKNAREFNDMIDKRINSTTKELYRAVWNRVYQNTMRLCGVLAIADHPDRPEVTMEHFDWASKWVTSSVHMLLDQYHMAPGLSHDYEKLEDRVLDFMKDYYANGYDKIRSKDLVKPSVYSKGFIPYGYLLVRARQWREYRTARNLTKGCPIKEVMENLIERGKIVQLTGMELKAQFKDDPEYRPTLRSILYQQVY